MAKRNRSSSKIDEEVGRRIRIRRHERGLTQLALGEALDLTFQQIQKYENGKNRVGAGRLQQIAKILDVPVSFFFADDIKTDGLSQVSNLLDTAYALRLLQAFDRIKNNQLKKKFVELMEQAASELSGSRR